MQGCLRSRFVAQEATTGLKVSTAGAVVCSRSSDYRRDMVDFHLGSRALTGWGVGVERFGGPCGEQ